MSERAARSEIVLRPIGSVASVVSEVKPMRDAWAEVVSEVRVAPPSSRPGWRDWTASRTC
jgi:hypothetical protein